MHDNIIHIDEAAIKGQVSELVRGTVEETLNQMLDAEADEITKAQRYERSPDRQDTRAGYYNRHLLTKAGQVDLKVPRLRKLSLESAIIERYKRRESSIEEALIETIGCSGMTHSAAMASEILPGKTILEALNTDLVCDAINTAMRNGLVT